MKHCIYIGLILIMSIIIYFYVNNNESFQTPHSKELVDILENINNNINKKYEINKIKETNLYYTETLPKSIKEFLTITLNNSVINQINNMSNYNYVIMNYETVIVQEGTNGTQRYLCNFFLYQTHSDIMIKLVADLVQFTTNVIHINSINISNSYINKNSLNQSFSDIKSTSCNMKNQENTKLDYSFVNKSINTNSNDKSFNPWIIHKETQLLYNNGYNGWPCGKDSNEWDSYGIKKTKPSEDKLQCIGNYNKATTDRNILPSQNPTTIGLPKNNKYGWLFDLFKGIPSFPTGSSLGSGAKNIN